MRLLQVATISETLEAFLLPFAERFRSRGWQVDGAATRISSNEACVAAFSNVHDVAWSRNPLHPRNLFALRSMRRLLELGSYDIVHVHTPVASFVTRAAAKLARPSPPVVYTAHGFHFHEGGHPMLNSAFVALERIAGPWTRELVTINRADFEAAQKHRLVTSQQLKLIPGIGFDSGSFTSRANGAPSRADLKSSIGVPVDAKVVLMVAEFTPNKRHEDALRALASIDQTGVHLVLVGKGDTSSTVGRLAQELGISQRVHFLGYRRDVPDLMTIADALVLLSEREGLPRSVMEAMSMGVPVVGTNIRGVADLLADGAGSLVPVGRPDLVAAELEKTLAGGDLVASRIAEAHSRLATYSVDNVLDQYSTLYDQVLS